MRMNKWEILREFINIREKLEAIAAELTDRDADHAVEKVSKAMTAVEKAQRECDLNLSD